MSSHPHFTAKDVLPLDDVEHYYHYIKKLHVKNTLASKAKSFFDEVARAVCNSKYSDDESIPSDDKADTKLSESDAEHVKSEPPTVNDLHEVLAVESPAPNESFGLKVAHINLEVFGVHANGWADNNTNLSDYIGQHIKHNSTCQNDFFM